MKKVELSRLLDGTLLAAVFRDSVHAEVRQWTLQLGKRGASAPLYLTGDEPLRVSHAAATGLLENALKEELDLPTLHYVVEALLHLSH